MTNNGQDDLHRIFLKIATSQFDCGDLLDDTAVNAFKLCLKGGLVVHLSADDYFEKLSSLHIRHVHQQGADKNDIERQQRMLTLAKITYEDLKATDRAADSFTQSKAFKEALVKLITSFHYEEVLVYEAIALSSGNASYATATGVTANDRAVIHDLYQRLGPLGLEPAYPYRQLDVAKQETRLLILLPSRDPTAPVKCLLVHNDSVMRWLYAALSYVWGPADPNNATAIQLNGVSFPVTPNLYQALQNLRHGSLSIYLWVDAICINQSDMDERNYQVRRMRSIYEDAAVVFMWLGDDGDDSHLAMQFLLRLEDSGENWPSIAGSPEFMPHLLALAKLMKRDYWTRVWIMQEVVLSLTPLICCGQYGVLWSTLAVFLLCGTMWDTLDMFNLLQYQIVRGYAKDGGMVLATLWFQKRLELDISALCGLMHSRQRHATELHDHVFGIAGFVLDLPVRVDYNVPVPVLYQQLARSLILKQGNLDVLTACHGSGLDKCEESNEARMFLTANGIQPVDVRGSVFQIAARSLALTRDDSLPRAEIETLRQAKEFWTTIGLANLPSWVPCWEYNPVADSEFIHLNSRRPSCDNAAAGLPLRAEFLSVDRELSLLGIIFDTIDTIQLSDYHRPSLDTENLNIDMPAMLSALQIIRDDWKLWADWTRSEHNNPYGPLLYDQRIAFRETTSLGCYRKDDNTRMYRDHNLDVILNWGANRQLNDYPQTITEAVAAALALSVSHRFFITKGGYMGKGKTSVKPGDIICVLYGSKVPFVLRQIQSKYLLIGECYVHGIMDGEAVSMRSIGELSEQEFTLI